MEIFFYQNLIFMKRSHFSYTLLFICGLVLPTLTVMAQNGSTFRTRSFDAGWAFKKDSMSSGPEKADFDVSGWRKVDLPHDWSNEDLPNQIKDSIVGPFSKAAEAQTINGFMLGGTAWYRNAFKISKEDQGKTVYLQFDGVYMNADVWVNGYHLGNHPYGYTPFYYDLTPYLLPVGKENVIAVQVKNEGRNSRWYSGSGIYRHVWLTLVNPIHVDVWGVNVTTSKVSEISSDIQVVTTINNKGTKNESSIILTEIIDAKGNVAATAKMKATVSAGSKTEAKQIIPISKPKLWSPQLPNLYQAKVSILINNQKVDMVSTTFGIREIKIDAQHGLLINGVGIKLKGGCIHHDNGPLGSVAIDRAEERKIELLKANGFNAIRTSHNPPSQIFLDVCDRMGMLVLDEAFDMWEKAKFKADYHLYFKEWWDKDLTAMILRDRNHPSVFLWSIGNEIGERADSTGLEITKMLKQKVRELDTTRLITEAVCDFWDARRKYNWEDHSPAIFNILDVGGYNYMNEKYEADHQKYPNRIIVGTESFPMKVLENWQLIEKHPYIIGDFVWTAMDYRGESGIGRSVLIPESKKRAPFATWPWFNAFCGDLDLIGDKKPQSYYRDVVWRNSKIEIMAKKKSIPEGIKESVSDWGWPDMMRSWNWPGEEGKLIKVFVYTRCQVVKLELNGKVIGEQKVPENSITVAFDVLYEPGTLVAKGFDNGKEIASTILKTTGDAAAIRLKTDRNKIKTDPNDLAYVSVEIIDASGNLVPNAEDIDVNFTIIGNSELAAVGNGNPMEMSSFQQPHKKVFHGKGLLIIRPTGNKGVVAIKATSKGMKEGLIKITVE